MSKLENINSNRSDEERKVINSVNRIEQQKNLKALLIANVPSSQHEDTTKIVTNLAAKLEATLNLPFVLNPMQQHMQANLL